MILSSPLARAQETAEPLAQRWRTTPVIEPRVSEIPSPTKDLKERGDWLRRVMADNWKNLDEPLHNWRRNMLNCVYSLTEDCVIFCHFIAINVLAGEATGTQRLISFRPDNGSITRLRTANGRLTVLSLGHEAETTVN